MFFVTNKLVAIFQIGNKNIIDAEYILCFLFNQRRTMLTGCYTAPRTVLPTNLAYKRVPK